MCGRIARAQIAAGDRRVRPERGGQRGGAAAAVEFERGEIGQRAERQQAL